MAGIWNKSKQRRAEFRNTAGSKVVRRSQKSQLSELKHYLDNTITCLTPAQLSQSINLSTLIPQLNNDYSTDRLVEYTPGNASPIEVNFENFMRGGV